MSNSKVPSDHAREQAAKRIFNAKRARRKKGGLLYRNVDYVKGKSSLQHLKAEAQKQDLYIVRIDESYVIICGKPEIEVIC